MKYYYQFILIGSTGALSDRIESLFRQKTEELKIPKSAFRILRNTNFDTGYAGNQPAFAVYFGDRNGQPRDSSLCRKLLREGVGILPVYFRPHGFPTETPPELYKLNGLLYNPSAEQKIVSMALEAFHLLRITRKIFISYRRAESSAVAIQLYETLEKNNFDVFLDTHCIRPGEDFEEILWHRMTDSDVVVMLNTKGFLNSIWCNHELAEAHAKQIAIVQLVWPDHQLENTSEICLPIPLHVSDFEAAKPGAPRQSANHSDLVTPTARLTPDILYHIVNEIESIRARNLASRQDNLITEFLQIARKAGKKVDLQPQRFITEERGAHTRRIFIPTVGIPQSIDCNRSEEFLRKINEYEVESIYLIYDDVRIRNRWLNHLAWLNNYLQIKTIPKQAFSTWLQNN